MSLYRQTKKLVTPVTWFADVRNGEHLSAIQDAGRRMELVQNESSGW
jgi:hypothetical protein